MVAAGWAFLMLAVALAASGIAHDAAYIFARRKMTRARVLLISCSPSSRSSSSSSRSKSDISMKGPAYGYLG